MYDGKGLIIEECAKKFISKENFCELGDFMNIVDKITIMDRDVLYKECSKEPTENDYYPLTQDKAINLWIYRAQTHLLIFPEIYF